MKLKTILLSICMAGLNMIINGQVDTTMLMDSTIIIEAMPDAPEEMEMMETAVAAVEDYEEYVSLNKFRHKKIKTEEKPDKKAVYNLGTVELLKEISDNLRVPYGYGSNTQFVIIQFVVGKDSMLYNPEVLLSPGAEYSINASAMVEKLQGRFLPATKNGKPVDTIITIPIRFEQKTNNDYHSNIRRRRR